MSIGGWGEEQNVMCHASDEFAMQPLMTYDA